VTPDNPDHLVNVARGWGAMEVIREQVREWASSRSLAQALYRPGLRGVAGAGCHGLSTVHLGHSVRTNPQRVVARLEFAHLGARHASPNGVDNAQLVGNLSADGAHGLDDGVQVRPLYEHRFPRLFRGLGTWDGL